LALIAFFALVVAALVAAAFVAAAFVVFLLVAFIVLVGKKEKRLHFSHICGPILLLNLFAICNGDTTRSVGTSYVAISPSLGRFV